MNDPYLTLGVTAEATDADIEAAARGSAEAPRRLWPWLLLGALAVSLFEWWIYNRRVYL